MGLAHWAPSFSESPVPKGDCYIVAANAVLLDPTRELVLVHGRPRLQCPPYQHYGHAWVETPDGTVIDRSSDRHVEMSAFVYYALGNIDPDECFRYEFMDTVEKVLEFEHYGPWEGPDAE